MKRKLYGNNIQPSCEHCANGKRFLRWKGRALYAAVA